MAKTRRQALNVFFSELGNLDIEKMILGVPIHEIQQLTQNARVLVLGKCAHVCV